MLVLLIRGSCLFCSAFLPPSVFSLHPLSSSLFHRGKKSRLGASESIPSDFPPGTIFHYEFARKHGIARRTLDGWIEAGSIHADIRPKQGREHTDETSKFMTLDDQARALEWIKEKESQQRRKTKKSPPENGITAPQFARKHDVSWETFTHCVLIGYGEPFLDVEQWDRLEVTKDKRGDYLTPEQQKKAKDFWKRHGVTFTLPEPHDNLSDM